MDENLPIITTSILKIGKFYVKQWNMNAAGQQMLIRLICTSSSVKSILCMCYGILAGRKEITRIEEMESHLLDELETEAANWVPDLSGRELTRLMKSIWVMNNMLVIFE